MDFEKMGKGSIFQVNMIEKKSEFELENEYPFKFVLTHICKGIPNKLVPIDTSYNDQKNDCYYVSVYGVVFNDDGEEVDPDSHWGDLIIDYEVEICQGIKKISGFHVRCDEDDNIYGVDLLKETKIPLDVYVEFKYSDIPNIIKNNIKVYYDYMDQGFGHWEGKLTLDDFKNEDCCGTLFYGEATWINKIDYDSLKNNN